MVKMNASFLFVLINFIGMASTVNAMVYDNRHIPLYSSPRFSIENTRSVYAMDSFFGTASKAIAENEREVGIPELHGELNLSKLADAFVLTGRPNPLPTAWRGLKIPYRVRGKVQMHGFTFCHHQNVSEWVSFGFATMFMSVNARHTFVLSRRGSDESETTEILLGEGDLRLLDDTRRAMFSKICLNDSHSKRWGFGDIDMYMQLGNVWDYKLKCRRVDAGVRFGVLFPTSQQRSITEPMSIPFGGNKHWGLYGQVDAVFELKEDMKVGFLFRISKRLAKTQVHRLPVLSEPRIFAPLIGPARIDPGITSVLSPYILMENLRQGLGFGLQYTLVKHERDNWRDARPSDEQEKLPTTLFEVRKLSEWASDYATLTVFYDFGKVRVKREFDPIISFRWDVPTRLFVSERMVKTHRISLGIQFAF